MSEPTEVFVSVRRKRKSEVGLAYTLAEREAIGDVGASEWSRVRYVLPPDPDTLAALQTLMASHGHTLTPEQRARVRAYLGRVG